MRQGFIMMFTIFFLVVFSSLTAMIFSLSSDIGSTSSKLYLFNQAKLLARTGNEIAILMVQNRPPENKCLEILRIKEGDFNITLNIGYIGKDFPDCNSSNIIFDSNFTETNGTIFIDVYVETVFEAEHILFHRRTTQKP